MATYIPNATQTTEPVESRTVESAALEFRTLKASINARVEDVQDDLDAEIVNRIAGDANLQTQNNSQDVRIQAIEAALLAIGEGGLPGTVYVQRLSGTGAQTTFTLNVSVPTSALIDIFINGLYQNKDTFTIVDDVLTFSEAPPAGTDNVEVVVSITIANVETDASLVSYRATDSSTTVRTVQDKMREWVSVKDFGAVGDGVTDDTVAVSDAVASGFALDWGRFTYRITTPLIETVARLNWRGDQAQIIYDGPQVQRAVDITCGMGVQHTVEGLQFDGGGTAHVAVRFAAATVDETLLSQWPSISLKDIVCRNAFRADTSFGEGDGIRIAGGFANARVDGIRIHDIYMAVGAGVFGSAGVTGITFSSFNGRCSRHIWLENYDIRNVWSLDPTYTFDQDAVRIFQEAGQRTSSCYVLNGVVINNGGRAIKLHSGVNAVVRGLYREKSSASIPQSGLNSNPDIDAQQAPANISDIRFHYDGVWHQEVVRNHSVRPENYDYGGALVSNISGRIRNAGGNTIRVVGFTRESGAALTDFRASVSDISIDGPVQYLLRLNIIGSSGGAGVNTVVLSNAIAEVTGGAVFAESGTARLRVTATNIHNTAFASPSPLGVGMDVVDRQLTVANFTGFTPAGAYQAFGSESENVYAVVPSDAGTSDTDTILLLQPTADQNSSASGVAQLFRNASSSAGGATLNFLVSKQASSGDLAGHVTYSGHGTKTASLILCTFGGTERVGIRLSGGGGGVALAVCSFTGKYTGTQPMRIVPASAVAGIVAMPQRAGWEPVTEVLQPLRIPSYVKAALPSQASFVRSIIWVSDAAGGAQPAYSDGTDWRRFSDGAIVS